MKKLILLLALFTLLLSACAGSAESVLLPSQDPDSPTPSAPAETIPVADASAIKAPKPTVEQPEVNVTPEIEIPTGAETLVELAKQRLSSKFGFELDEIHLFSITPIEWPDASLGCPQPGIDYAQVITSGYQIIIRVRLSIYTFHTDTQDQVVFCQEQLPDNIFIEP